MLWSRVGRLGVGKRSGRPLVDRSSTLVSVVIPTHNDAEYLRHAIGSCLTGLVPLEFVVVDDSSVAPPPRKDLVSLTKPHRLRYVRLAENIGVGGARNRGLRVASGDLIQFLDADDVLEPGKIASQAAHLEELPAVTAVFGPFLVDRARPDLAADWRASARPSARGLLHDFVVRWERGFTVPIHSFLFRTRSIRQCRFREDMCGHEDWVFYVSLLNKRHDLRYVHSPSAVYRLRDGSISRSMAGMAKSYEQALMEMSKMGPDVQELVSERG